MLEALRRMAHFFGFPLKSERDEMRAHVREAVHESRNTAAAAMAQAEQARRGALVAERVAEDAIRKLQASREDKSNA
jgi:hypothetical protein